MAGKSTLALFCVAEQQKKYPEKMTAYIDMEQALDPVLAATYGVDISKMLISQPMTGEEALDITEALVRSAGVSCIVVDSVAALLPTAEDENDMSQMTIGLQARLMSKALRKLTPIAAETGTTIIFINQIREKVGSYGNPETTSGGRALAFYSSVRIEVRAGEPINEKSIRIGHETKCRVTKNKVAPPFRVGLYKLIYGKGVDRNSEVVDIGTKAGIIKQGGAWLSYDFHGEEIKAQGKEKFAAIVAERPELYTEVHDLITGNKSFVIAEGEE